MMVTRVKQPEAVRTAMATVLFADLRGYTGMAERLPAARVVPLLEEFFRVLASATETYGGTVFHMAGDGMMAGFGLTGQSGNGAADALAAGHAMLQGFAPMAARWRSELSIEAGIGVGLHLGEVAWESWDLRVTRPPRWSATPSMSLPDSAAVRGRGRSCFSCTVATALNSKSPAAGATAGAPVGSMPFLQLPQFELRGRRVPIDIWCVPAAARLAL